MPYLVKQVKGELLDNFEGIISLIGSLNAKIGVEDYFDVGTMVGFTQNFSQAVEVTTFPQLVEYGLKNKTQFIELQISYKQ